MNDREAKKSRWSFMRKKPPPAQKYNENILTFDLKELLEEKGICLKPRSSSCKSSRLSPSLLDVLKKSVALGYFLDYLNDHGKKNLLDFWLEAETFRMVLESKYKRSQRESLSSISSTKSSRSRSSSVESNSSERDIERISTKSSLGHRHSLSSHSSQICSLLPEEAEGNNSGCLKPCINLNVEKPCDLTSAQQVCSFKKINEEFRLRARSCIVDGVSIYNKYISLNAENYIYLPQQCRQKIEASVCTNNGFLESSCFVNAQQFIFEQLLVSYDEFVLTSSMVAYQLRFLQEKKLHLRDVLYNDLILFYFTEFLDQCGARSILEFHFSAENFEDDVNSKTLNFTYDKNEVVNDAIFLYERYFSMKCEKQLIKDDKLRIVLENNICREDGPQSNCFCIPMAYAWTALSEVYLPRFLLSENYKRYIDHLTKTLRSCLDGDLKSYSSLSSLSTEDSFVAISHSDSKNNLLDEKDFLSDSSLKPHHHKSRLALGHINEFGLFSSTMEPLSSEENSSVSKLGKAMKNLIRGESKEETEHLALERAKKIISDIQRQTQVGEFTHGDISHSF